MTAPALQMPTYAELRRRVAELGLTRGEWAGVPVPIEGFSLHIEPSYPYQALSQHVQRDEDKQRDERRRDEGLDEHGLAPGERLANSWYSERRFSYVFLVRDANGRGKVFTLPHHRYVRRIDILLSNFGASWAHDLEAETTAMITLSHHITNEQLRQYMVLGQFIEKSKRSGVTAGRSRGHAMSARRRKMKAALADPVAASSIPSDAGSLSILNTCAGDIVVTFNDHDDTETDRAIAMLLDMQKRGYAILVRQDDGSYERATSINRETKSYVIGKLIPAEATTADERPADETPATSKRGRRRSVEQPIKGRRAVGVARSAGGCHRQSPLALLAIARKQA